MAGKLPDPVGATRRRLDQGGGARRPRRPRALQASTRARVYDLFIGSLLTTFGFGVVAVFGFDMPAPTMVGPLVFVFFLLFAVSVMLGGRR